MRGVLVPVAMAALAVSAAGACAFEADEAEQPSCSGATCFGDGGGDVSVPDDAGVAPGVDAADVTAPPLTACGAATIEPKAPMMLDHDFWGYHGVGVDGTYAYYPDSLDGRIMRIPLAGGRPTVVVSQPYVRNIKSRGGVVCWMSANAIVCRDASGALKTLHEASGHDDWSVHRDFDFDDTDMFWIDLHSVWRVPMAGGSAPTLVIDGEETTKSVAIAGDRVVWSTDEFSAVRSCTKTSCAPVDLTYWGRPPTAIIGRLSADASHVYVPVHLSDKSGRRGGKLVRIPVAGGPVETLVDCLDESPVTVGLDSGRAYLLTHAGQTDFSMQGSTAGGSVYSLQTAGGDLRRLATAQPYPVHIAFAPQALVWMSEWDRRGELMLLAR